ncbi:MAG: cyclic nucleotide-binding domain-containing protein [Desulfobacterales bacterium]
MANHEENERLVERYMQENNIEAAVNLLFDLIVSSAGSGNISKAKILREKLLEVAPLALTEITKAADIIEEEESKLLDPAHLSTWSKLYSTLTTEETHALFFAMEPAEYKEGETVYVQGEKNARLYFIDRGRLKRVYRKEEEDFLVNEFGPGDLSGKDSFFSITNANAASLIAVSGVKLRILHNKVLKEWGTIHPGLFSKLHDFCTRAGKTDDVFTKLNIDRKMQKRFEISVNGKFQLLKNTGEPLGDPFKGTLSDISSGGLCFFMRVSRRETARLLVDRKIKMEIQIPTKQGVLNIEKNGIIVGVHEYAFQDYSIHVKFDQELGKNITDLFEEF